MIPFELLENLCSIVIGRTPSRSEPSYWGTGHKWVTISDLSSKTIYKTKEEITDTAVKQARCKKIPKGTLLFSFKLSIGKKSFAGCDLYTNEAIAGLMIKDQNKLNSNFLYYALEQAKLPASNEAAKGKTLNSGSLAIIQIPLPSLDDQKRIAFLLGKVESLIARRKDHLEKLDTLIKSIFVEMFGDPVKNEMGWDLKTINDLVDEVKYGTSASAKGGPLKYIRMNNITYNGYWDFDNLKYVSIAPKDFSKYSLQRGDLVFNRTNSKELVGKTAVYNFDESVVIAGYLIRVRVNLNNNPWYIWGYLNSKHGKAKLAGLCRNIVGMANINAQELKAIPIAAPPLSLQNQFAAIVEKVEGIQSRYQKSLAKLEKLYGALSQKAFKGELDLSRVPLPPDMSQVNEEEVEHHLTFLANVDMPREQPGVMMTNYKKFFTYPSDLEDRELPEISIDDKEISSLIASLKQPFDFEDLVEAIQEKATITPAGLDALAKSIQSLLQQGKIKQTFDATLGRAIRLEEVK